QALGQGRQRTKDEVNKPATTGGHGWPTGKVAPIRATTASTLAPMHGRGGSGAPWMSIRDLPAAAWAEVWRRTALATAIAVLVSVSASEWIMSTVADGLSAGGLAAAILMPLVIGGPMSFWHLVRLMQLRHANERL